MNTIVANKPDTANQIDKKAFPVHGTNLDKILFDTYFRQNFHARLKRFNPLIVWFYRTGLLPLFGASRNVMLLTTRGNKSGKMRTIPIGYFRIGGVVHLFSAWGRGTAWYKNLIAHPEDVQVQIGLRRRLAQAQPLEKPDEIQQTLEQLIYESPAQAQYLFGWNPGVDQVEKSDFSQIVNRVLIIRFIVAPH